MARRPFTRGQQQQQQPTHHSFLMRMLFSHLSLTVHRDSGARQYQRPLQATYPTRSRAYQIQPADLPASRSHSPSESPDM